MVLESFLVTQVGVSIGKLRRTEVIRDGQHKCQLWKTIEENKIGKRSRIEVRYR